MLKKILVMLFVMSLLTFSQSFAAENYKGKNPPSIQQIYKTLSQSGKVSGNYAIVGLHKEREGAYQVFTNKPASGYGGPFQLIRLESGEWLCSIPSLLGSNNFKLVEK